MIRIRNLSGVRTAIFVAAALAIAGEAGAVEWNVSLWGKRRAFTEHVEKLAELVAEKTGGAFTMNISYGGLSKNRENLDGISVGAFEMAQFCAGYHGDKNPTITVLELPFLGVMNLEEEVAVSNAVYAHPATVADLARWNARLLMTSPMPQYNIVGTGEPKDELDEFKGMRVRATGGLGKAFEAVGAVPTSVTATEAQQALETGVVDTVAFAQHAHLSFQTIDLADWWTENLNPGTVNCPDVITVVPVDQISTIDNYEDIEVVGGPGAKLRILIFNQGDFAHPMMKNAHLRRALSLAVDRQLLVDALFAGRASVPNGLQLPSFGEVYDADYPVPVYDPERAREELAKSGYDGEVIDYPLLPNVIDTEVAIAEVLREMWKAVGINVELQIRENWKQITRGHHSIRNMSATMVWQDPATILWRLFKPSVMEGRGWGWVNDTFNANGTILENEPDKAARRDAFRAMMTEWETADPMGIVLFQEVWLYGKKTDLGWQPYVLPYMDFGPNNV